MVIRGTMQILDNHRIDQSVTEAKRKLQLHLEGLDSLNHAFIRSAKGMNQNGFEGRFYQAFMDTVEKDEAMVQRLYESNQAKIGQMTSSYRQLLDDISFQDYQYQTELIPLKANK